MRINTSTAGELSTRRQLTLTAPEPGARGRLPEDVFRRRSIHWEDETEWTNCRVYS